MNKKIITLALVIITLILIIWPLTIAAKTEGIKLNVAIGGHESVSDFGQYISIWYRFIVGSVGILATVMIMWSGFKWLTSRGNTSTISQAKENIWAAIIGLLIAFLSYIILSLINPGLLNIGLPALDKIQAPTTGSKFNIEETYGFEGYKVLSRIVCTGLKKRCWPANYCRSDPNYDRLDPRNPNYLEGVCCCGDQ